MQVCHFQHLLRQFVIYEPLADKNEPGRFLGEGVSFRAKLIGVLEVPEARGDRMCQEALADLKMAIRAAGEHKQRIQVHVAIDGLRLRDDKTGDSLYHHPVHKISFIAQDMTDSRAFGYIFGSPDTGHRFFGIKTDKAASQVVIAMRDLFQVVFELKKKEVEMAKQQLEGKILPTSRHVTVITDTKTTKSIPTLGEASMTITKPEAKAEGGVAELVDLEQELCSLRRGLTQVEGLTPSTDPFGDSFIVPSLKGLLPPPPSGPAARARSAPTRAPFSPSKPALTFDLTNVAGDFEPKPATLVDDLADPPVPPAPAAYDVFTELDPLGTGRSKPYVDKKLFFQELKNPPKKVLKDLVPSHTLLTEIMPPEPPKPEAYGPPTTMTSLSRHSGGSVAIAKPAQPSFSSSFFTSDPFAETDPFDNTDPFSDTFKDDPFTSMQEFPKISSLRTEDLRSKISRELMQDKPEPSLDIGKNVFNGPLQVSLPPEPAPKSPRLARQNTDTSTIRQRPQPLSKLNPENSSPPPPLPPKKVSDVTMMPPPRPPHDHEETEGSETPPLPKPARKKEPLADRSMKPRQSSLATTSSEDEYLTPAPPPLPTAKRFDITLCQLLTLTMDELAARLRVPAATLSSMTLPQLTSYLRNYVATENEKAHVHVDPTLRPEKKITPITPTPKLSEKPLSVAPITTEFKPQFEDNFAPTENTDTFVANFDDFDKKANSSYDKYAAFREIQDQELKAKSLLDPIETDTKLEDDNELTIIENLIKTEEQKIEERKELDKSPLKSLDELTIDSFNMFRNSVSPKPIDAKIEDIKTVMKNLQIERARRSVSPRDNGVTETKSEDSNDKYAALREITITEPPQEEFESIPPEVPKERKKSDEKSDGFDNSDFFDCIDNSSLSFNVEDAFRKSPGVKEKEEEKKVEEIKEIPVEIIPARDLQPPMRLSAGSISDVPSGSSPDTKGPVLAVGGLTRLGWTEGWSSDSRESEPRQRRRRTHNRGPSVQTSSSSRDVSPWDEEPPIARLARPPSHRDRDSRHNSSGSRECLDSGSGREKEKIRDKRGSRDRDLNRDGRESARDRRDSGSGRDRREVSKERDHRDHRESRDRRDRRRDRDKDTWSRDRNYSRERDYRDTRSRDRSKDYRDIDRHRKPRHSYDEEDYSDGCGSGRSSPRERWPDQRWRRDDRNYGSLGWRETRRRNELRQGEDPNERRYGSTLGWPGRRSATVASRREAERELRESRDSREARDSGRDSGRDSRDPRDSGRDSRDARDSGRESGRDSRDPRDSGRDSGRDSRDPRDSIRDSRDARRRRREEPRTRPRDYRFSNDFSPREREHTSPFDNDFQDSPSLNVKKRAPYSTLDGTRFVFETEDTTASPLSGSSARARDGDSPATRFRFDSDSLSPRSMFEDDFTTISTPRGRTASIAEEEEGDLPPLRAKPQNAPVHIKKSDSVNIFSREADPFEGDAFFACTGSDRVARRENWPGDFQGFDNT
ncbi:protein disabled isoform X3 [Bicyclus anynana]|uniref:Protein disabled isoform X3 n=1 Tax=Bicyclus anynana TaxID=110368 RepID=A0A6J1P9F4_BICAN|nr:protein disabled isoform X3 [Bicyclus anynana]XP_052743610.1 protein disabled isoform X3 [Bicyclus anynana]